MKYEKFLLSDRRSDFTSLRKKELALQNGTAELENISILPPQRFYLNALHLPWSHTPTLVRFLVVRPPLYLSAMPDAPTFWSGASPSSTSLLFTTMAVPENRVLVDKIVKNEEEA